MGHLTTRTTAAVVLACLLLSVGAREATADALKCEAGQTEAVGRYAQCWSKAERTFVLGSDAARQLADLQKCSAAFSATWDKLEAKAAQTFSYCPGTSDAFGIQNFADACQQVIALRLAGEPVSGDPLTCEDDLLACYGVLNACTPVRADAEDSADACQADSATCPNELAACQDDVAACDGIPNGSGPFRTEEATSYGPGSDGDLQLGTPRSFADNGDGTITDNMTGLMWEKKDESGGIHDKDNRYRWCDVGADTECDSFDMAGPLVTGFLATLNSGPGFAGYTDWRIPNLNELTTLRRARRIPSWATYVEFDNGCTPGCTVTTCSCTWWTEYWSSSTSAAFPPYAWTLKIGDGLTSPQPKEYSQYVRAVRGGS